MPEDRLKVKVIEGTACPKCDAFIPMSDMPDVSAERFQCGECGELYGEREDARDCYKRHLAERRTQ